MLEHQHLIVRGEIANPPQDTHTIEQKLKELVSALNMKIMMGPISGYSPVVGNRGLTCAVIIETSHIVLHTWDEESPAMLQLDVYSCSEVDPEIVWKWLEDFEPVHIDYKFLDRKTKFITVIEKNS